MSSRPVRAQLAKRESAVPQRQEPGHGLGASLRCQPISGWTGGQRAYDITTGSRRAARDAGRWPPGCGCGFRSSPARRRRPRSSTSSPPLTPRGAWVVAVDPARATFVNGDLTIALHCGPVGQWMCRDAAGEMTYACGLSPCQIASWRTQSHVVSPCGDALRSPGSQVRFLPPAISTHYVSAASPRRGQSR